MEPSAWILNKLENLRGSHLHAIDIAAGRGRHSFALLENHFTVTAVDRNTSLKKVFCDSDIIFRCLDLEGVVWPLTDEYYDLVLISNYLYRPFLNELVALMKPGGYMIYETFGAGNEVFGKPSNSDFLLNPNELSDHYKDMLQVLEEELVETDEPKAVRARFFARKPVSM